MKKHLSKRNIFLSLENVWYGILYSTSLYIMNALIKNTFNVQLPFLNMFTYILITLLLAALLTYTVIERRESKTAN
jgi:prolipoprotein diacylglyceryltransferase